MQFDFETIFAVIFVVGIMIAGCMISTNEEDEPEDQDVDQTKP